jgi:ACS family hexuronate transporter-like MFS transporter
MAIPVRSEQQVAARPHTAGLRWYICALLFFATTINYIDRQVFSILAPDLQRTIGWNEEQYGDIVTAFHAAYAIGLLLVGRLMDTIGTRAGFALIMVVWSLAAMAHSLASSAMTFAIARFALGLGEAGNFPASIKTVAEWFPKRERAFATGIFNAGSNVGAIIAPLTVPWLALTFGWKWAFIVTGAVGFVWLIFWNRLYRRPEEHERLSSAELAHIRQDSTESIETIGWKRVVPLRQTWAFAAGKFMTDPIWWLYLYWLAKFLNQNYGVPLAGLALPIVVVYLAADAGSVFGGWFSSKLIKRGWTVNKARKTAMFVCAACVVPVMYAPHAANMWTAVGVISLAAAAHQGWSANLFTLTSDIFPRRAVASVVGLGGMFGAIGGMFVAQLAGKILQMTGSYVVLFIIAGSMYLIALAVIHILAPRLEPVSIE